MPSAINCHAPGKSLEPQAERVVRLGLTKALPRLSKPDVKRSLRWTFQALRIVVNDEFAVLDALLGSPPLCLAPGGRVAIITFQRARCPACDMGLLLSQMYASQ